MISFIRYTEDGTWAAFFSFPALMAPFRAVWTDSASASAPSCRFQNTWAPRVEGDDGRLFWWMLTSTAPGMAFTRSTRLWRSETFFSRSEALPGS